MVVFLSCFVIGRLSLDISRFWASHVQAVRSYTFINTQDQLAQLLIMGFPWAFDFGPGSTTFKPSQAA